MDVLPQLPQSEIFGVAAQLIFACWPGVLVIPMLGERSSPWGALGVWFFLLAVRAYVASNPLPSTNALAHFTLIPEPTNTYLFFAGGAFVALVIVLRRLRVARHG